MQEPPNNINTTSSLSDLSQHVFFEQAKYQEANNACLEIACIQSCITFKLIDQFIQARDKLPSPNRCLIYPYSTEEYLQQKTQLFLTYDHQGGFGITADNELISLFSYPRAKHGSTLVEAAKALGACHLSLYELDSRLSDFYKRHGFQVVETMTFDKKLAPANWDYERFGTPNILRMSL